MKRLSLIVLGLATCLELASAAKIVPGRGFDRLITIWLENQDYAKAAIDNNIADLKRRGILLDKYYAHTHPSQPNYLAAIAGDYFGLNHDEFVRLPENVYTVADLLESKDISWAGYFEDLPGPGFMGNYSDGPSGKDTWDYVRKHNPFVTYDSITNDGMRLLGVLSFDDFQLAFKARQVPQFIFMSPNMMNDGHNTTLQAATDWSHQFLLPLLADNAFDERTLIMLTFDESETYSEPNHIVTLLLGSAVPPALKGTQDSSFYTHYSMLSSIEYNWDLPHLGRYDVGANVFQFLADIGGYKKNKDPENIAVVNNSVSYPGFLHNETSLPIPRPNSKLVGASGLGILDAIRVAWPPARDEKTPYDGSGRVYDGGRDPPVYNPPKANSP
ncbi:phosphoesterase family-domain-containing protein [Lasiosphaeria hispida]|uniref:Phosphoesterase family-domain-containing protein n=1 Tax=Lasiosphaeria hispida TaxID=260671 RepID=A0AAJ0H9Q2_9PEZI|nr:phosphoesterase family-domain-containing protein [Lasiosphaeria hispida]